MDLKSIVLKEVPSEIFIEMRKYWGIKTKAWLKKPKSPFKVYSRIINPITTKDYESLLLVLQECKGAGLLSVRKGAKEWIRNDVKELSNSKIRELAKIASEDEYQREHLEIKITKNGGHERATIGFTRFKDEIIGYDMLVPYPLSGLVTIEADIPDEKNGRIKGLWVPDDSLYVKSHILNNNKAF